MVSFFAWHPVCGFDVCRKEGVGEVFLLEPLYVGLIFVGRRWVVRYFLCTSYVGLVFVQ